MSTYIYQELQLLLALALSHMSLVIRNCRPTKQQYERVKVYLVCVAEEQQ